MKHEINGLQVTVSFNREELKSALLKKIINEPRLCSRELRQRIIEDLINDKFMYMEIASALMDLEQDEMIESDFKVTKTPTEDEKGRASRCYFVRGSNQTARSEQ